jgi:galactose mutarotase-like enzyme
MAEPCPTRVEEENVLIQAGDCSISVLPHLGGKISSIRVKGRELLQAPLAPLTPRSHSMAFDESDASGWDECLPSVAECDVQTDAGAAHVPDHGDLWRVEWQPVDGDGHSDELQAECFSLPLQLRRKLLLTTDGKGSHLQLKYKLTNSGSVSVPWSWAAHPLFAVEAGDRIVLPETIHSLLIEGSGGDRLGAGGKVVSWPIATLADGSSSDQTVVQSIEANIGDKLFAGPLAGSENWCALERPSVGVRLRFRFDTAEISYLGLWICYGGWPERPGSKQMCVALEPSTAPVDSLARPGPWSRVLAPGKSYSWSVILDLEPI